MAYTTDDERLIVAQVSGSPHTLSMAMTASL